MFNFYHWKVECLTFTTEKLKDWLQEVKLFLKERKKKNKNKQWKSRILGKLWCFGGIWHK